MPTYAEDNPFPYITLVETADPSTPAANTKRVWLDTDGTLKVIDEAAAVTNWQGTAGLSDPMTTRGDVIIRNASNVTDRLAIGASGKVLTSDGTDISWQTPSGGSGLASGTSFPGGPSTNDLYYRTDRALLYFYNGTRWLTTTLYVQPMDNSNTVTQPLTTDTVYVHHMALNYDYDQWLESAMYSVHVTAANSGNTGSHYWTFAMSNNNGTSIVNVNTSAITVATWTKIKGTIGALAGTSIVELQVQANKTGTPGDLYHFGLLTYRLVG